MKNPITGKRPRITRVNPEALLAEARTLRQNLRRINEKSGGCFSQLPAEARLGIMLKAADRKFK